MLNDKDLELAYLDLIVSTGNNKDFLEIIEPSVTQPLQLEQWMVRRTIIAMRLIEDVGKV